MTLKLLWLPQSKNMARSEANTAENRAQRWTHTESTMCSYRVLMTSIRLSDPVKSEDRLLLYF